MTETFTAFLRSAAAAAALIALLPAPDAQAQMTVYYGGKMVYAQKTGMADSAQFVFNAPEAKASQECDASTVGGSIAKESQAVDLGLSVKWAPWNVGAKSAAEAGAYFAWGEVQAGKSSYDWESYYWIQDGKSDGQHITKYQTEDSQGENYDVLWYDNTNTFIGDGKTTLESSDDAAAVNWGGKWRMPTQAELAELSDKCTWEWKEEGEYATGSLAGYLVTGPNGNSIFLPAAGYRWYSGLLGSGGYYWSSELDSGYSYYARNLYFYSGNRRAYYSRNRSYGMSVRAVLSAAE